MVAVIINYWLLNWHLGYLGLVFFSWGAQQCAVGYPKATPCRCARNMIMACAVFINMYQYQLKIAHILHSFARSRGPSNTMYVNYCEFNCLFIYYMSIYLWTCATAFDISTDGGHQSYALPTNQSVRPASPLATAPFGELVSALASWWFGNTHGVSQNRGKPQIIQY